MQFDEFMTRFGGSARTKHVRKRPYPLPEQSEIPKEFIRLCPWEVEYLFTVARRAKVGILETGRYNGGSLFVMACAAPAGVPIYSIDIGPQNDDFLRQQLSRVRPKRPIEIIVGDSQHTKYPQIGPYDLLFIDGDHSYEGCKSDIENWYPGLSPGGHMMFHDAYLGRHGVQDAILDFVAAHPELETVQPAHIGASHWLYSTGSIAHFVKRPTLTATG